MFSDARCYSLWGDNKVGWINNIGDNGAGSVLSMWHKYAFCNERHIMGNGYIAISDQHLLSMNRCVMVNVYTSCNLGENRDL